MPTFAYMASLLHCYIVKLLYCYIVILFLCLPLISNFYFPISNSFLADIHNSQIQVIFSFVPPGLNLIYRPLFPGINPWAISKYPSGIYLRTVILHSALFPNFQIVSFPNFLKSPQLNTQNSTLKTQHSVG